VAQRGGPPSALLLDALGFGHRTRGTPLIDEDVYRRVIARTRKKFGRSVNVHVGRDIIATSVAVHDPQHVRSTATLLDHSKFETTERHYIMAQSFEASRRYQTTFATYGVNREPATGTCLGRDGRRVSVA